MPISELIHCPFIYPEALPAFQKGGEIRYPPAAINMLLEKFTQKGDRVFDPFTGFGTTFFCCEQLGRVPYGIEIDPQRYDWVKARIQHKENLFLGNTRQLATFDFPPFDFSVTSPPYMPSGDAWNPLRNGDPAFSGYDQYLCDLQAIYKHVRTLMKKDAYIIVQVDNMTHSGYFSPQVWDVGRALSFIMPLEGEIIFHGDRLPNGTTPFMHCLVFKA